MTTFRVVAEPVVLDLPPITGRIDFAAGAVDLVRPLGNGFFVVFLALDCAASQPAKSGSPLSLYEVVDAGFETDGAPHGFSSASGALSSSVASSSPKPPQSLLKSSASSLNAAAGSGDVIVGTVVELFVLCSVMPGLDANGTGGLLDVVGGGTEADL